MSGFLNQKHKLMGWFYLTIFFISIFLFFVILFPRDIRFLKTISVLARYNSTRFLPVAGLMLLGALSLKNQRLSTAATALLLFPAFALALNGLWAGAYSENNVIAGLIPRTDALSFYGGAVSLLESGYLVSYAKRRPLFGGFLAFLLWVSGGNLQITLALMTYLLAAVTFFSVLEVRRALNPPAAVVYFVVLFLFIRRFIGITMSENMGVLLGVSSFTLFLIYLRTGAENHTRRITFFLGSVFLFALAQVARPGAMATLPLLVLFAGWIFRRGKKPAWNWMAVTLAVITLAFLSNTLLFHLTTLPGGTQTNNIGFGIYGLAVGGKGWEQIFSDHPELDLLTGAQFEQAVYRFIWEAVSAHPENFLRGMLTQFRILFSFAQANSMYSFMWSKNILFSTALIGLTFLLSISAVIFAFRSQRKEIGLTLLLLGLGFLLSLPVAPAYQTRHMRVYAASLPFLGFLPAAGMFLLTEALPQKFKSLPFFSTLPQSAQPNGVIVFTIFVVTVVLLGPLAIRLFSSGGAPSAPDCPAGEDAVVLRYYPGSSIHIFRNDPSITTWVPYITQLDYKGSIHSICCDDEILYFEEIKAPNVMFPALNQLTGNLMYMIVDESMLPDDYGLLQICGRIEDVHGEPAESGFLYPRSIQLVD